MSLADRLNTSIPDLAAKVEVDRSWLFMVLKQSTPCSPRLAKRIEAATNGEIRAVWLLGLEAPPDLHLPTTTDVVKAS